MSLASEVEKILSEVRDLEGHITEREMVILAVAALFPTAKGEILEIGSFKGKSTCILSKGALLSDGAIVYAVDPLTSPSKTDPDLKGKESVEGEFRQNISDMGVEDHIKFYKMFSQDLAKKWNTPLRLLWIDGDHTYKGAKQDFDNFSPYLVDGAIIMIDDVLHRFSGPLRVYLENIVLSDHFGAMGLCGSIGWAQYKKDRKEVVPYKKNKITLYRKLSKLVQYVALNDIDDTGALGPIDMIRFKFLRSRIPHKEINLDEWVKQVSL